MLNHYCISFCLLKQDYTIENIMFAIDITFGNKYFFKTVIVQINRVYFNSINMFRIWLYYSSLGIKQITVFVHYTFHLTKDQALFFMRKLCVDIAEYPINSNCFCRKDMLFQVVLNLGAPLTIASPKE